MKSEADATPNFPDDWKILFRKTLIEQQEQDSDLAGFAKYFRFVQNLCTELQLEQTRLSACKKEHTMSVARLDHAITRLQSEINNTDVDINQAQAGLIQLPSELLELREELELTFDLHALQKAEKLLQSGNEKEESINLSKRHVMHEIECARETWHVCMEAVLKGQPATKEQQRAKICLQERIMAQLDRVCIIEKNRVLGFSRDHGPLPVYTKRAELHRLMADHQVVTVTAGTGCGKSTQLPQYIVNDAYTYLLPTDGVSQPALICCTQPRRLAAQRIARRVADEYQTQVGDLVGFRVGKREQGSNMQSKMISESTHIEFVTEGVLLNQLTASPGSITRYACIIIDEAHERNKETDLLLAHLRNYTQQSGAHLIKIVVMSASIDAARFCEYFGDCPSMHCSGKIFEVVDEYWPMLTNSENMHATDVLFKEIVDGQHKDTEGDVLIFSAAAPKS